MAVAEVAYYFQPAPFLATQTESMARLSKLASGTMAATDIKNSRGVRLWSEQLRDRVSGTKIMIHNDGVRRISRTKQP